MRAAPLPALPALGHQLLPRLSLEAVNAVAWSLTSLANLKETGIAKLGRDPESAGSLSRWGIAAGHIPGTRQSQAAANTGLLGCSEHLSWNPVRFESWSVPIGSVRLQHSPVCLQCIEQCRLRCWFSPPPVRHNMCGECSGSYYFSNALCTCWCARGGEDKELSLLPERGEPCRDGGSRGISGKDRMVLGMQLPCLVLKQHQDGNCSPAVPA